MLLDPSATRALLSVLRCPACRGQQWTTNAERGTVACARCARGHQVINGVLHINVLDEHPDVQQERASVPATELSPELGGWREVFTDDTAATSSLAQAYLSLPYGNDSAHFQEPGYFQNVQRFAPEFDFILRYLPTTGTLLDVGADGTWSTARLAGRGLTCVALDITDHLALSRLFHQHGPPYSCVNVDMHDQVLADRSFDAITAFNALHHSKRLFALAANIARMLKPDGVLGFVEPYVQNAQQEAAFGASQSAVGINENVHALDRWDEAFHKAGLTLEAYSLTDSFNAIYRKRAERSARRPVISDFYAAELSVTPAVVNAQAGEWVALAVHVASTGRAAWATRGPEPTVRLSYHLACTVAGATRMVAFDNDRTWLSTFVGPGHPQDFTVQVILDEPGSYDLTFELVHETHRWFGTPATAQVNVE
ncbi:MAG TPA: class I SAM-dependent methyltransferase [Vicinamibacterales bacterium]|nr:class I SAM-dependent methyltransferase [Vicinamibacterales bacterium]